MIEREDIRHELAVLRPKRGDIVVLYVPDDTVQVRAGILREELLGELRRGGVQDVACFVLPHGARLQTMTAEELARLGLRRV